MVNNEIKYLVSRGLISDYVKQIISRDFEKNKFFDLPLKEDKFYLFFSEKTCGKTFFAHWILYQVFLQNKRRIGKKSFFYVHSYSQLYEYFKNSYEFFSEFFKLDFLILDNFGLFERRYAQMINDLLSHRIARGLPTYIFTGLPSEDLEAVLGERFLNMVKNHFFVYVLENVKEYENKNVKRI